MVPLNRLTVWGTRISFSRSWAGVRERVSRPSSRIRPPAGSKKPMSRLATVLLPQPDRPTKAVVLPRGISRVSSRRAGARPG